MPRIAIVNKEKCYPQGCGGYLCIRVCPENRMGKECIVIDPIDKKIMINEETCGPGVAIAANRCPFEAIKIINLPEELDKPIHRYGKNGFALYKLPIPQFGKVTGIIGRNGIGKTTAIKIISGLIKPNFGKEKDATHEEVINYFKGSEAQTYFEKVKKREIKISYKPQQVDQIPKTTKGKVKDLLKKIDEKNQFNKIIELLDLKPFLDNDIEKLSGGELQKVAIAATALKKANLYVFDEPTSYLDIKQRIKVSKFIKELADENTAVLVVEHDLIILDYMTEIINIMYGKEGCYGVVSLPKTTKEGINAFLSGYIKEENMRFRGKEITFLKKTEQHKKIQAKIIEWDYIEKILGNFKLTAQHGQILKNQIIGVLGENGIGKTTFMRLLAKEIIPEKGELTEKVVVSYKPQYLTTESDQDVSEFLYDAIKKYEKELIAPLEIRQLLQKKLNQLSGGELQRVAIVNCLSKQADLFLLDEPSAYLDVEQRINISRVIKNFAELHDVSIIIVDHDLLFADYISDNLLIFDGQPAICGEVKGPYNMEQGMNCFLKKLSISMRREQHNNRPRINKENSVLDREQKTSGQLYY